MKKPKITMAQLELFPSDIERNTKNVINTIKQEGTTSDFIVFPELTISGYTCGENFEKPRFINDCIDSLREIIDVSHDYPTCCIIVGAPSYCEQPTEHNGTVRLYNSAFVILDGKVIGKYNKTLLANDCHHEDRRYFQPGNKFVALEHANAKFSILICEDIWRNDHDRDLVGEIKANNPNVEYIFTLNFSYFTYKKTQSRVRLIKSLCKDHNVNIIYVNAVALGDIVKNVILYDGDSFICSPNGVYATCEKFKQSIASNQMTMLHTVINEKSNKYENIWEALLYQRKITFEMTKLKPVVLMSGGLDSNIVAVQCVEALGAENCVFITCPSVHNGDVTKNNAQLISDNLNVPLHWIPIEEISQSAQKALLNLNSNGSQKEIDKRNLLTVSTGEAISRSLIGLMACHQFGGAMIATGNHTEEVLGWSSFHDPGSIGIDKPLGDLTKEELWQLSAYINKRYKRELVIPDLFNGKIPGMAELADSVVDPFDYKLMSGICASIIRNNISKKELIDLFKKRNLPEEYFLDLNYVYSKAITEEIFVSAVLDAFRRVRISVYKTAQGAPIVILSPRSRGFSSRETIYNFYLE